MTRVGYQIPNFTYPGASPADVFPMVVRQARAADASGFDTALVMDHFYQLPMLGPPDNEMFECYTLLSAGHIEGRVELLGEVLRKVVDV